MTQNKTPTGITGRGFLFAIASVVVMGVTRLGTYVLICYSSIIVNGYVSDQ
ncbi:MAG: hypothetical protein AAGG53_12995 [Cyanobacteria bacterium P01_H01_bin.152]